MESSTPEKLSRKLSADGGQGQEPGESGAWMAHLRPAFPASAQTQGASESPTPARPQKPRSCQTEHTKMGRLGKACPGEGECVSAWM